jgi:hypothetical protein
MTLLIVPFQKHCVGGAERKSRPELQSNEPGTKREVKGGMCLLYTFRDLGTSNQSFPVNNK